MWRVGCDICIYRPSADAGGARAKFGHRPVPKRARRLPPHGQGLPWWFVAILNADSPNAIPGEFLVRLHQTNLTDAEFCEITDALSARHGGEIPNIYAGFSIFFLKCTDEQAEAYASDSVVAYVERNGTVDIA
jgi:hypothetical protein